MGYFVAADLTNVLGARTVVAAFDDDADGVADTAAVDACIECATAEVDSFLVGVYQGEIPFTTVPTVIKYAALDFACAYVARRRPDLMRAMGEESWEKFSKAAKEKMRNFIKSEQRIPKADGTPDNTGAEVRTGDGGYPTVPTPARKFDRMGDF